MNINECQSFVNTLCLTDLQYVSRKADGTFLNAKRADNNLKLKQVIEIANQCLMHLEEGSKLQPQDRKDLSDKLFTGLNQLNSRVSQSVQKKWWHRIYALVMGSYAGPSELRRMLAFKPLSLQAKESFLITVKELTGKSKTSYLHKDLQDKFSAIIKKPDDLNSEQIALYLHQCSREAEADKEAAAKKAPIAGRMTKDQINSLAENFQKRLENSLKNRWSYYFNPSAAKEHYRNVADLIEIGRYRTDSERQFYIEELAARDQARQRVDVELSDNFYI